MRYAHRRMNVVTSISRPCERRQQRIALCTALARARRVFARAEHRAAATSRDRKS
jgi:hypothetical protein